MTRWLVRGVYAALAAAVLVIYVRTAEHTFVNYLDDIYAYDNPGVLKGLSKQGYVWAFTHTEDANWIPLTFLTHMLDWQVHQYHVGRYHLTNVALHLVTSILLFLVLREMTGKLWPSAFAAAVFAVHPLRVESVAWIAERKDVLSGLFFVLTIWAYTRYVRKPSPLRYPLAPLVLALGLMSKPMLVTVPFLLLLLDYWPLRRYATNGEDPLAIPRRLWIEKIPFFALSATACAITIYLHLQGGLMDDAPAVPLFQRAANAAISGFVYLGQLFWPFNLAVYYPLNPGSLFLLKAALSVLVLAAISTFIFRWRRQYPWLWVGWLWYLGMLVPILGLVQIGGQSHADRYTYLPHIGLIVALTWAVAAGSVAWRNRMKILGATAGVVIAGLIFLAHQQTGFWRNSEILWSRTLACTSDDNIMAHNMLGNYLAERGQMDKAMEEAQKTLALQPTNAVANNCLGFVLLQKGRVNEAIFHFEFALKAKPDMLVAERNLGLALVRAGRVDEAITHLERVLELNPDVATARTGLGSALLRKGMVEPAVEQFEAALKLNPDATGAADRLAWVRATATEQSLRNGLQALGLAERANDLTRGTNITALRTLAAAQAEAARYPEAIKTASTALDLAQERASSYFIEQLERDLRLYQSGQPLRTDFTTVESTAAANTNLPSLW